MLNLRKLHCGLNKKYVNQIFILRVEVHLSGIKLLLMLLTTYNIILITYNIFYIIIYLNYNMKETLAKILYRLGI